MCAPLHSVFYDGVVLATNSPGVSVMEGARPVHLGQLGLCL